MKLNYRNTILVGFAFLAIQSFWQMYDNVIPLVLTNTFELNKVFSGIIMAADNILALFLLPLFGTLSDRTSTKLGKRMPYILCGTVISVILLNILPFFDNSHYSSPAQWKLAAYIVTLGLLLVAMGTYRSPAVALMPDVTPKPLRSKGNAVINLMGAVGGILYLAVAAVLYPNSKTSGVDHVNYQALFICVSVIMLISVIVLLFGVKENKLTEENRKIEEEHPEWEPEEEVGGNKAMPRRVKMSFFFLLASIAFWYMGYNGVTTWFSTYADNIMGRGIGEASTCLLIATAGAVVSYIPIGFLSSRIGRKKTVLIGAFTLAVCFGLCYFLTVNSGKITPVMMVVFALIGFAWAAINVNSFPMAVEMCKDSDIGKFTGLYYAASMAAQVVTPVLASALMEYLGMRVLFPYAAFFVALSFVTMLFVFHGDSVKTVKAEKSDR